MKKTVKVLGKTVPVMERGVGKRDLLIVGPASIFYKKGNLPEALDNYFTIYFVDIFMKPDEEVYSSGSESSLSSLSPSSSLDIDFQSQQSQSVDSLKLNYPQLSMNDFVDAVDSIRQQLRLDKVYLFAHSALGVVAFEATRRFHKSIKKTFLVCTSQRWGRQKTSCGERFFESNASDRRKKTYSSDQREAKRRKVSDFSDVYYARRSLFLTQLSGENFTHLKKKLFRGVKHDDKLIQRYFEILSRGYELGYKQQEKSVLQEKLVLLYGLHDYTVPITVQDLFINKGFDYHIFEKSSHYPIFEEPVAFTKEVIQRCVDLEKKRSDKIKTNPSRGTKPITSPSFKEFSSVGILGKKTPKRIARHSSHSDELRSNPSFKGSSKVVVNWSGKPVTEPSNGMVRCSSARPAK